MTPTADDRGGGFSGPLQGELYRWRSFATAPRLGGGDRNPFSSTLQQGQCPDRAFGQELPPRSPFHIVSCARRSKPSAPEEHVAS
jgi:hypothetical protein